MTRWVAGVMTKAPTGAGWPQILYRQSIYNDVYSSSTQQEATLMAETQNRAAPINIRARPTQRNLIDKAAAMLNKSRSDFMLEAACREAENVLLDRRLFLVDENTHQAFEALLDAPVNDNPALRILLNSKAPWEQ